MIPIAVEAFKRFGPYIAIAAILALVWFQGYSTADSKRIEQLAQIRAESDALFRQYTEANTQKAKLIDESNQKIEETSYANRQIIETLADRNRDLANRVQQSAGSRRCTVSSSTSTTESSNGADTGTWQFFEPLVQLADSADRVTEVARACQNYVKSLEGLNDRH